MFFTKLEMNILKKCPFCQSDSVIKHGTTTNGKKRFRCRKCLKTWVEVSAKPVKPDLSLLTEKYLEGDTLRSLAPLYYSSPLRFNQKMREFLSGCPNWEDYLDTCTNSHKPDLVYLIGKTFSASTKRNKKHNFLAMAVDALSTIVLAYEIGADDSPEVWNKLLARMHERKIIVKSFMSNGSKIIEEAILSIYPSSNLKIFYNRAYRDKELNCCLNKMPINSKLLDEAVKTYECVNHQNLSKYLKKVGSESVKVIINKNPEIFIKKLRERIDSRPKVRVEGLLKGFQERFEKFHSLKSDPRPMINGWMLSDLDTTFSRLSLYLGLPAKICFKDFSCGNVPELIVLKPDSSQLQNFILEYAARSLQLPIFYFNCELNSQYCELF